MGAEIDRFGPGAALQIFAIPTAILVVIFGGLLFYFKARGGYRPVQLPAGSMAGSDSSTDSMSLAHLTLPTRDVDRPRSSSRRRSATRASPVPGNSPVEALWLDIGRGQQMHVFYVEGFEVSPFEGEFGRHVAVFYPLARVCGAQSAADRSRARRSSSRSAPTPFERFFFREPVNGYVFEVIDQNRASR